MHPLHGMIFGTTPDVGPVITLPEVVAHHAPAGVSSVPLLQTPNPTLALDEFVSTQARTISEHPELFAEPEWTESQMDTPLNPAKASWVRLKRRTETAIETLDAYIPRPGALFTPDAKVKISQLSLRKGPGAGIVQETVVQAGEESHSKATRGYLELRLGAWELARHLGLSEVALKAALPENLDAVLATFLLSAFQLIHRRDHEDDSATSAHIFTGMYGGEVTTDLLAPMSGQEAVGIRMVYTDAQGQTHGERVVKLERMPDVKISTATPDEIASAGLRLITIPVPCSPEGVRVDAMASLEGTLSGWDYETNAHYFEASLSDLVGRGYSVSFKQNLGAKPFGYRPWMMSLYRNVKAIIGE